MRRRVDMVGDPGKVQVLGFSDSLSDGALNADRWRVAVTNLPVRSLDVRTDDGLAFTFPRGFANRMFAHPPDHDNDGTPLSWADTYGLSTSPFWACVEHLLTLEGEFVGTVDLERLPWGGSPRKMRSVVGKSR